MKISRSPEGYSPGVASSRTGFSGLSSSSLVVFLPDSFSEATSGGVDGACVEPGSLFASRRPGADVCSDFSPSTRAGVAVMMSALPVVQLWRMVEAGLLIFSAESTEKCVDAA